MCLFYDDVINRRAGPALSGNRAEIVCSRDLIVLVDRHDKKFFWGCPSPAVGSLDAYRWVCSVY